MTVHKRAAVRALALSISRRAASQKVRAVEVMLRDPEYRRLYGGQLRRDLERYLTEAERTEQGEE